MGGKVILVGRAGGSGELGYWELIGNEEGNLIMLMNKFLRNGELKDLLAFVDLYIYSCILDCY